MNHERTSESSYEKEWHLRIHKELNGTIFCGTPRPIYKTIHTAKYWNKVTCGKCKRYKKLRSKKEREWEK